VIGTKVCRWNGSAWVDLTADSVAIQPAFHWIADETIYAVTGSTISLWSVPSS
jgi:hypothetical protein